MNPKVLIGSAISAVFVILAGGQIGNAGTVTVLSSSDFTADTTGQVTTNFNGILPPVGDPLCPTNCFTGFNPLIVGGIQFSTAPALNVNVNSPGYNGVGDFSVPYIINSVNTNPFLQNILTITLPTAVTAFGLDFGTFSKGGTPVAFTLSNGFAISRGTGGFEQAQFLGFISTVPFSTITLKTAFSGDFYDSWVVTDVTTASATTPLPATLPLFATGLGALGLLGWRRKRKAVAIAAA
jgi:hypothetical protein